MIEHRPVTEEEPLNIRDYWKLSDYDKGQIFRQASWFLISRLAILGFCCAVPVAFGWILGLLLS